MIENKDNTIFENRIDSLSCEWNNKFARLEGSAREAESNFRDLNTRLQHFENIEKEKKERKEAINSIIAGVLFAILVVLAVYGAKVLLSGWLS